MQIALSAQKKIVACISALRSSLTIESFLVFILFSVIKKPIYYFLYCNFPAILSTSKFLIKQFDFLIKRYMYSDTIA